MRRISAQQKDQIPESLNKGFGSYFERSPMNSFYRENQIGPFLCVGENDKSTSYNGKMKKWKIVLD